ncbi:MAG: hypothetical protein WCA81_10305 [Rhizomicrobium sp.]
MIVYNFHIVWSGSAFRPFKANAPLIVDPDAPLSLAIATQFFEPVAAERCQFGKVGRSFQPNKPVLGLMAKRFERVDPFAAGESLGPLVAVAQDHASN